MLIPTKLGISGITPPSQQKPAGKNLAYEEGVKKINKERLDTVKYLRETEARIRTVREVLKEVGTESAFAKQQKTQLDQLLNDQATYNTKIKRLDSRLKDPKLVATYMQTKQDIPQELKPSFGQEVLLGEKEWQKALVKGQNKYNTMANNALESAGFKYVPEGIIKDITKGVLNPLSYTQTVADVFGNPTKWMDDTFYTMANPNASAEERALGGLNFVLFVASVVPGAAALKRGGVKQLLDEAVEKAVAAGVKVESAINKVKKALDPTTYKNLLDKAKELGKTYLTEGAKKVGAAKETAKDIVTGKSKVQVKMPTGVFSGIPLPSISVIPNPVNPKGPKKSWSDILDNVIDVLTTEKEPINLANKLDITKRIKPIFDYYENPASSRLAKELFDVMFDKDGKIIRTVDQAKQKIIAGGVYGNKLPKEIEDFIDNNYNDFATKMSKGELWEKNGLIYLFPKELQDQITQTLLNKPEIDWIQKFKDVFKFRGFRTEKRTVRENIPELLGTVEGRVEDVAGLAKQDRELAKEFLPIAANLKNANSGDVQIIKDALNATSTQAADWLAVRNLRNKLEAKLKANFFLLDGDQAVFDLANKYLTLFDNAKMGSKFAGVEFAGDKSILQQIIEGSFEDSKVFSLGKFKKYFDDPAKYAKEIANIDPTAILYEASRMKNRRGLAQSYGARKIATEFLNDVSDNNNLNKNAKKAISDVTYAMEETNKALAKVAPDLDKAIDKGIPGLSERLGRILRFSGGSQIAGNISTALSQLTPLPFTIGQSGYVNFIKGFGKAISSKASDDFFSKSTFITNRIKSGAEEKLYTTMRDNFLKSGSASAWDKIKKVYGEGIIDTVSKYTLDAMDGLITKTVYAASYYNNFNKIFKDYVKKGKNIVDPKVRAEMEDVARRNADFYTEAIISGREVGAKPPVFNSEWGNTIFQYGLELMAQPAVINELQKNKSNIGGKVGAIIKWITSAYLLNNVIEKINNRRPNFDIIGSLEDAYKGEEGLTESPINPATQKIPVVGGVLTRGESRSYSDKFRLPARLLDNLTGVTRVSLSDLPSAKIFSTIFNTENVKKLFEGENSQEKQIEFVANGVYDILKGGGQVRKTVNAVRSVINSGYADEQKLSPKELEYQIGQDLNTFINNQAVQDYKNKVEQIEKKGLKFDFNRYPIPEAVFEAAKNVLFGPKGTKQYRETQAEIKLSELSDEEFNAEVADYPPRIKRKLIQMRQLEKSIGRIDKGSEEMPKFR